MVFSKLVVWGKGGVCVGEGGRGGGGRGGVVAKEIKHI